MKSLRLSELMGAMSHALDITEGQPEGHCVRCCWIGMNLAEHLGLTDEQKWELYYTLLLKDLGCSSNAARICELYATDDLSFKRDFKTVDGSLPQVLRFVFQHTGATANLATRLKALMGIISNGDKVAHELILTRCTRGADIARKLRFPEAVAAGIHSLDEHWDGSGRPEARVGEQIPLYSQIALLAQVVDVFNCAEGQHAAEHEASMRQGGWFSPGLVQAFLTISKSPQFWETLNSPNVETIVFALEPGNHQKLLDEDYLDDIAEAFGQVVDAKSPYTAGHSSRVALYTDLLSVSLGVPSERRRWLKRGALLHDVGKLGVSNSILDKPGKLDDAEWEAVRSHATFTGTILGRIKAFEELARVSSAHHERLDGGGYPLGLSAQEITLETRIITTADIFDAITAERPYRGATSLEKTLQIMGENIGTAIDERCYEHLKQVASASPELFPK